jgi:hypothetical protein
VWLVVVVEKLHGLVDSELHLARVLVALQRIVDRALALWEHACQLCTRCVYLLVGDGIGVEQLLATTALFNTAALFVGIDIVVYCHDGSSESV